MTFLIPRLENKKKLNTKCHTTGERCDMKVTMHQHITHSSTERDPQSCAFDRDAGRKNNDEVIMLHNNYFKSSGLTAPSKKNKQK